MRTLLTLTSICILLSGCSSLLDASYRINTNTVSTAPAGYASYKAGIEYENRGDTDEAELAYCNAADLGFKLANSKCEYFSLIKATDFYFNKNLKNLAGMRICKAEEYGSKAKKLCHLYKNGVNIAPYLKETAEENSSNFNKNNSAPTKNKITKQDPTNKTVDLIGDFN